jgi:hypothetical protein
MLLRYGLAFDAAAADLRETLQNTEMKAPTVAYPPPKKRLKGNKQRGCRCVTVLWRTMDIKCLSAAQVNLFLAPIIRAIFNLQKILRVG